MNSGNILLCKTILIQAEYVVDRCIMYVNCAKNSANFTASPDKYPQGKFNDKPCRMCGKVFSPLAPSHLFCSDGCAERASTEKYLQRTYGISVDEYEDILVNQNYRCAICGGSGFTMATRHKAKLVVDHCHTTGVVRGLLCHNCNRALGLFKDDIQTLNRAITYLEGATTIPLRE